MTWLDFDPYWEGFLTGGMVSLLPSLIFLVVMLWGAPTIDE